MLSLAGIDLGVNVIDAFDECQNRKSILKVLSEGELPANIRFIITTRAEEDVMASLEAKPRVFALDLNVLGADTVFNDITLYARHRLDHRLFGDGHIGQFVTKADGHFQWAATACNYISNDGRKAGADQQKRFDYILSKGADLNALYCAILEGIFPSEESEVQSVKSVLAKVLAAAEPLSIPVLQALCINEAEEHVVDRVIPYLGSVLTVSSAQSIRPVHTSFRDFLTNQEHSHQFWIDVKLGHQSLAQACFQVMKDKLCFNICNIKSSYHSNSDLVQEQVDHISPALFYACQFWADHMKEISIDDSIGNALSYLLLKQLLFWLEVLSIKQSLHLSVPALEKIILLEVRHYYDI
jgi:hypothetical protein